MKNSTTIAVNMSFKELMQEVDSVDCWEMYLEEWLDPETKKMSQGQYIYGPTEFWTKDSIYYFVDPNYFRVKKGLKVEFLGKLPFKKINVDSIRIGNTNYSYYSQPDSMNIEYSRLDRIWVDTLELFMIRNNYKLRRVSTKDLLKASLTKPKYRLKNYSERFTTEN